MSVGELLNLYRDGELDIHPEFQRFFRWTPAQKSRFIESLLLGIPIPSCFVHQRHDGVWDVIDGLQRLSTIFEFVGELADEDGQTLPPSTLEGTEYLPSLARKKWTDGTDALSPDQQRLIKRASIDIKIVKRESDEDTKYDLFQRLNTGGSQLSAQELRNCLLIMVDRTYYLWLRELEALEPFLESAALSDKQVEEQYDLELIIRFLSLKDAGNEELRAVGDMNDFLTTSSVETAKDQNYDRTNNAAGFRQTFELINSALSDSAFRRYNPDGDRFMGGFSVSAFEAMTAGVYTNRVAWSALPEPGRSELLVTRAKELWQDQTFRDNAGSGIRASSRIPRTVPRGRELFVP
ncbi:MAG TPA: DUF262 domain-containing protein [Gaiellaceae bacterium]